MPPLFLLHSHDSSILPSLPDSFHFLCSHPWSPDPFLVCRWLPATKRQTMSFSIWFPLHWNANQSWFGYTMLSSHDL